MTGFYNRITSGFAHRGDKIWEGMNGHAVLARCYDDWADPRQNEHTDLLSILPVERSLEEVPTG